MRLPFERSPGASAGTSGPSPDTDVRLALPVPEPRRRRGPRAGQRLLHVRPTLEEGREDPPIGGQEGPGIRAGVRGRAEDGRRYVGRRGACGRTARSPPALRQVDQSHEPAADHGEDVCPHDASPASVATVHHAALSFQLTFREPTRSPDRGSDPARNPPLSPWNDSPAPSPGSQIGPRTDSARRQIRPSQTRNGPTGAQQADGTEDETTQTGRNQTARASDHRRPLTASRAEAEGGTPSPETCVTRGHRFHHPRPHHGNPSSFSATFAIASTPQESHKARARGGAARRVSRNHPPSRHRRLSGPWRAGRRVARGRELRNPWRAEARVLPRSLAVDADA
jgi:hypothetical protein